MDEEIWKDIIGYEGLYQVSNLGRVASYDRITKSGIFKRASILKLSLNSDGYLKVNLDNFIKVKTFRVHILVAIHHIPNPENKPDINHIKGIKIDNRASQLEWATKSENMIHSYEFGLHTVTVGENHWCSKLTNSDVEHIRLLISVGESQSDIARRFGVTKQTISAIKSGKNWKL